MAFSSISAGGTVDSELRALVSEAARVHALDALMVEAVVMQESGGNPWAWNPEPRYKWFWDVRRKAPFRAVTASEVAAKLPPADFRSLAGDPDQEWWGQQASFGVMQTMGAVARELGCTAPYLTELCDPVLSLHYGCKLLAREFAWAGHDWQKTLSSYNGGRGAAVKSPRPNQSYADDVLARYRALHDHP